MTSFRSVFYMSFSQWTCANVSLTSIIKLVSGESLDPRVVEKSLNQSPAIAQCCVVGNNFLRASAQLICAIVELTSDGAKNRDSAITSITSALAAVNRTLAPPLRIAWSRVLILDDGQIIPLTKKRAIFRKKLESLFGEQLSKILEGPSSKPAAGATIRAPPVSSLQFNRDEVASIVAETVSGALGLNGEVLEMNSHSLFSEVRFALLKMSSFCLRTALAWDGFCHGYNHR